MPDELRDAARVDGAGRVPDLRDDLRAARATGAVTIALLTAIPTWNEYLLTRVSLNDASTYTLPIALQTLRSEQTVQYNTLMAGALIVVIPIIILFLSPSGTSSTDSSERSRDERRHFRIARPPPGGRGG